MKKFLIPLLALLLCNISASAALNAYMAISVNGTAILGDPTVDVMGSTDVSEMLELFAFRHELFVDAARSKKHKPVTVVKRVNKATPLLYQALDQNEAGQAVIHFFSLNRDTGATENHFTITLTGVTIVRVQPWMPNTLDLASATLPVMEEVTMSYQTMTVTSVTGSTETTVSATGGGGH